MRGRQRETHRKRDTERKVFLAPIITDFIRNTKRELYAEKLEDALEMLDLERSKDDDTKTQCNRLNTSPLHRGNASNKNGPARVKRRMQWEAPVKPLAVDDPLLLPERAVHAEIGINWFLDQEIPKGGYVRILVELLLWEERLGKTKISTTEGLTTCMESHRGWTIVSSSWNFYESHLGLGILRARLLGLCCTAAFPLIFLQLRKGPFQSCTELRQSCEGAE